MGREKERATPPRPGKQVDAAVVFVRGRDEWPQEFISSVTREGYVALRIDYLALAPSFLRKGDVRALVVGAGPMGAKDLLVLRECREASPGTAIVAMTTAPTQPGLKRAFESGATAFLSWPAPPEVLRQALASGTSPAGPTTSDDIRKAVEAMKEDEAEEASGLVVDNRLPAAHPQRKVIDTALRDALEGLPGRWDVSVDLSEGRTWTITVVAPDGSQWSMACASPAQEIVELIGERVRAACDPRVGGPKSGKTASGAKRKEGSAREAPLPRKSPKRQGGPEAA
jgi:hypothetical protein